MTSTYTLDDLQIDISDLHNQLAAIRDILHEMDYGSGDARNHELDRVAAMNRIADDMAGRMVDLIDEHYHAIKGNRKQTSQLREVAQKMAKATNVGAHAASDPLLVLIDEYNAARLVVNAVPENDPREKPFWDAYNRLCEQPPQPTTFEGALAGFQLVRDEERDCGHQENLTINVLSAALAYFEASERARA